MIGPLVAAAKPVAVVATAAVGTLLFSGEWIEAAVAIPGVVILSVLAVKISRQGRGAEGPG